IMATHQETGVKKAATQPPSPVKATYVEPSAEHILKPGTKLDNLFRRNMMQAIRSVTDKPVVAAIYPHYHADHIGDIGKYVDAARSQGVDFQIIASTKTRD